MGYYWVFHQGSWRVGHWDYIHDYWLLTGDTRRYCDGDFLEIGGGCLVPPE
jgi:hypothetical protein